MRPSVLFVTAAATVVLAGGGGVLSAASGDLLWAYRDDERLGFCSQLAVDDGSAYTYLWTRDSVDDAAPLIARIQRFDLGDGALLWEATDGEEEYPAALSARGDLVFSTSWLPVQPGTSVGTVFTRARDAANGDIVWGQTLGPGRYRYESTGIAAGPEVTVVAGARMEPTSPLDIFDLFVAAYDTETGALRWLDALDVDGGWDRAETVAIGAGVVVVGGQITEDSLNRFFVRAYDARRGRVLWEDRSERGQAEALVIRDGRVWAAGPAGYNFSDGSHVRSYDLRSGRLLWSRRVGDAWIRSLEVLGKRVIGGGFRAKGGRTELRAFARDSGRTAWKARRMRRSALEGLAVGRNRVYGVGPGFTLEAAFLASWKGGTGRRRWIQTLGAEPLGADVCAVKASGGRVIVAGFAGGPHPTEPHRSIPHQILRAYAP